MSRTVRQELEHLILLNYCERYDDALTASKYLTRKHGTRLIPGLLECLSDEDEEVREWAVDLLDRAATVRNAPIVLPALLHMLHDSDQSVRQAAAWAIQKFGTRAKAAIPIMEEWLSDDRTRLVATMTLPLLDPTRRPTFFPIIRRMLTDSDNLCESGLAEGFLEEHCLEVLNLAGVQADIPALISLINEPNELVRMAAAFALRKFGTKATAAIPALERWLTHDTEYWRVHGAITILCLDPSRQELLPMIHAAADLDKPLVYDAAANFLADYDSSR